MTYRSATWAFLFFGFLAGYCRAEGVRLTEPVVGSYYHLDEGEVQPSILKLPRPAFLTMKAALIEERQVIDFEQRAVSFERRDKEFGFVVWQYRYGELDEYIENRKKFAFAGLWNTSSQGMLKTSSEKKKDFNILQMELNVQYPTWARRLLGKDPPKLSITGYEEIQVSYEYSKQSAQSNLDNRGLGGVNFNQENEFTVTGSVGRLINVNIKATTKKGVDASDINDPMKNFKLEYKGENNELEDEVIQEVSAGVMGFSMPGTSLSGYSESHKGLIGIQVKSKIGPLELTTIASQERGEAQRASFDLTSSGSNQTMSEKDFIPNKMFFLDTLYRNYFLNNHEQVPDLKKLDRKTLQVWLSNQSVSTERTQRTMKSKYCYIGNTNDKLFKLLVEGKDYSVSDLYEGCIRFDSINVSDADLVGICMVTKDGVTINKGDTSAIKLDTATIIKSSLWMLKGESPVATDSNFSLMWRNIYRMSDEFDVSKFKIDVRLTPLSGDTNDRIGETRFSTILGLTDQNGNAAIGNASIFDVDNKLLFIPPFPEADGKKLNNHPFANPALSSNNTCPEIYSITPDSLLKKQAKFKISMSGSSKKTSFILGMGNIMDNTEKVTASDGKVLVRDVDYTLDYQFGTLTLISKEALSKTRIDVDYQSEVLFVPKSKVFLGLRGEMKLPFGQNSIIGASVLYQSASSQDRIPKIGQEPYSKLLLDANTKMDFEPKWMTSLIKLLPFLTADDKSTASLEVETANSITNLNTDGEAYLDDFESSNRPYTFGLDEKSWYQAAPPRYMAANAWDSLLKAPPAWNFYWYAPKNLSDPKAPDAQALKEEIFYQIPKRKNTTSAEKYEPVLNLDCFPGPSPRNDYFESYANADPWAGVIYPFPSSSINRTMDKYFEFYAKSDWGGRLYIDMGEISEDICYLGGPPDGQKHDEDTSGTGSLAFESKYDIGVDGRTDDKEFYLVPNQEKKTWDRLLFGDSLLEGFSRDPARDNFQTYAIQSSNQDYIKNFPFANGTEKNGQYNSRDILGDGLSINENYFRRSIDFDSALSADYLNRNAYNYMVLPDSSLGNAKNGWHLYRIPLNDTAIGGNNFQKIGAPRWDRIRFIRLFWTNFPKSRIAQRNRIQFARMQLVRNEWEETPIRIDSTKSVVKLKVSTINTEDNPEYANDQCPAAPRVTDESGNVVKETALRLNFEKLMPGDVALVRNVLVSQSINLSAYNTMSMSVHGDDRLGEKDDLFYVFRFGNDDSTYYEYRSKLYPSKVGERFIGWDNRNVMSIKLHEFSKFKQDAMMTPGGGMRIKLDTTLNVGAYSYYSVKFGNNRPPNFAGITWMAIGIMRSSSNVSNDSGYTGEFWVDELKVSGIHDFNGWATRAAFNSSWAGFMTLGGRLDYTGADFQQMTNSEMKLGNSSLSGGINGSWTLGKFLPSQWGINIPLGTTLSGTLTRPTLISNSDVYLTSNKDKADAFNDMYGDAINLLFGRQIMSPVETQARHYQSATVNRSYYTGWSKSADSKNPLVNILLDRLSLDYRYSTNMTQTSRGRRESGAGDYVDILEGENYNGAIKYSLTPKPAPAWTKWKPLSGAKSLWIPDKFKTYEFSLLPSSLELNVGDVTYTTSKDFKDRPLDLGGKSTITTKSLTLLHGATMAWDPMSIFKINYSLTINRNLDQDVNNPIYDGMSTRNRWKGLVTKNIARLDPIWHYYGILGGERERSQNTTFNFDPTLWDWLTISADYSSNYRQSMASLQNDPIDYKNFSVNTGFHLSTTLTLATMFKKFSEGLANLKAVAATFSSIEKGIEKLSMNNITLAYSSTMALSNNYFEAPYMEDSLRISRLDFLKYQLGLKGRSAWDIISGDMNDNAFGGMRSRKYHKSSQALQFNDNQDKRSSDISYSARTTITIPEPIDLNISSISLKYSKNFNVCSDSLIWDTTITFPDFDIGVSSQVLNKIKLITNYFQGMALSSNYNYQLKKQIMNKPSLSDTLTGVSHRFSPLVSVDGKLKKTSVNLSYSHTLNSKKDESKKTGISTSIEHINKVTASYEIQKSGTVSEMRLLFWTVPLKGTFTMGADAEQQSMQSSQETGVENSLNKTTQNSSRWSISPNASYTFTDNILGKLSFSASQTKKESETSTSYIFMLSVRITLK